MAPGQGRTRRLGEFGVERQHATLGETQQRDQQQQHQQAHTEQRPAPAQVIGHQQQAAAAGQHADLVAAYLQAVAQAAPALGQQAHGQPIGRHVLCGGRQVDQQQQAEQQRQPGAEQLRLGQPGQRDQQQCHPGLQGQDPASSMAERRAAQTVDPRRPQHLEQPGQRQQLEQADQRQIDTLLAQQHRQGVGHQPGGQTLGDVQRGEQRQGRRQGIAERGHGRGIG